MLEEIQGLNSKAICIHSMIGIMSLRDYFSVQAYYYSLYFYLSSR